LVKAFFKREEHQTGLRQPIRGHPMPGSEHRRSLP